MPFGRWLVLVGGALACTREAPPPPVEEPERPLVQGEWPAPDTVFVPPLIEVPADFGTRGVFVSAGHGTKDNVGNVGCRCQLEEDYTLVASHRLADQLRGLGVFDITEARTGTSRPSYGARLRHLGRSRADVMVELHSDWRGHWRVPVDRRFTGEWCYETDRAPGLAVLVSDEGSEALRDARRALARSVADALWEVGFLPYDGMHYGESYDLDTTAGVYIDRRGLRMLRRPKVPSIIIETHNALDPHETDRWDEPATHDAFFRAVAKGLIAYFADHPVK